MARAARIVIPNVAHHVTQRGNNRQDVFFTDDDRRAYLSLLQDKCDAAGVRVVGYCLMTNHVHLIVIPAAEEALANAAGAATRDPRSTPCRTAPPPLATVATSARSATAAAPATRPPPCGIIPSDSAKTATRWRASPPNRHSRPLRRTD